MNSYNTIREHIRQIARKIKSEQKLKLKEETKLRKHIRKLLLREIEEISPHDSTGINVLEDLLKTIIPILEANYKRLTSDVEQRKSFRAHIIRAVQNLLATESVYFSADTKKSPKQVDKTQIPQKGLEEAVPAQNEQDIEVPEDPAFIDIEKEKKEKQAKETEPKPEDAFIAIADEDPTGRGFALQAFNKIQKQILESYSLLGKSEDREIFYDYLITNLKLYFDKFEVELQKKDLQEPTTDAYEAEKQKIDASLGGGEVEAEPAVEPGQEEEEEPLA